MSVCEAVLCDGDDCNAYAVLVLESDQEWFSGNGWSFNMAGVDGERKDFCIICTMKGRPSDYNALQSGNAPSSVTAKPHKPGTDAKQNAAKVDALPASTLVKGTNPA